MTRMVVCTLARSLSLIPLLLVVGPIVETGFAQKSNADDNEVEPSRVLSPEQWEATARSVDRALTFLASRQEANGSFAAPDTCQPAVTGLCMLAFLSRGHVPGQGEYGDLLNKALDFVLSSQKDSGLLAVSPAEPYLARQPQPWDDGRAHALYNHGIAGLTLAELFGMVDEQRNQRIRTAVNRALAFSRIQQTQHKQLPADQGGWRYMFHNNGMDADLSVTSWQLKFYRAARNAEFEVPEQFITDALKYVRSCYDPQRGRFRYSSHVPNDYRYTRAMCGAGILALSLGGEHQSEMAKAAADSLMDDSFEYERPSRYPHDRYHYSVYFCTLAMFQLGGKYWTEFYPSVVAELLGNQAADGSWKTDSLDARFGKAFGNTYTTAMMVMVLTVSDQLIPIYQR